MAVAVIRTRPRASFSLHPCPFAIPTRSGPNGHIHIHPPCMWTASLHLSPPLFSRQPVSGTMGSQHVNWQAWERVGGHEQAGEWTVGGKEADRGASGQTQRIGQ